MSETDELIAFLLDSLEQCYTDGITEENLPDSHTNRAGFYLEAHALMREMLVDSPWLMSLVITKLEARLVTETELAIKDLVAQLPE